ncbi:hypothetical protein [Streptomyces coeruleorubidus]|uniref:hypothetical protein n=1 Tax=Streptomyces coeruleorubidus TaxID=116188 RepID=UPI003F53F38E
MPTTSAGTTRVGVRAGAGGSDGRGSGCARGVSSVAYVFARVPSAYTQCPWAASYSHTDSPSTTTPIRSPWVRAWKDSWSRPPARSSTADL